MTPEHRPTCQGLKYEHYDKWGVTTHDVGTTSYQASSLAQASAAATQPNSKCFKCGETKHWMGNFPKNDSVALKPNIDKT